MHVLLLTCVVLLGAESRTIYNGGHLVENDWSRQVGGRYETLSLRAGERWDQGVAWFIRYTPGSSEHSGDAYKGFYRVSYRSSEQGVLILSLGFTRKYDGYGTSAAELTWSIPRYFKPEGADLALTLLQGNQVPTLELELSIGRAFYVNEEGTETVRTYESGSFLKRIAGVEDVARLTRLDFATIGETLELQLGSPFQSLALKMPPAFPVLEGSPARHAVFKPTGSNPGIQPPKSEDPATAVYKKGRAAYENGEFQRAVTLFSAALELTPSLTSALEWRGYSHLQMKDYMRGGKDLSEVIESDPTNGFAFGQRAFSYMALGYYSRGAADYAEYVRLAPEHGFARNALAWALATNPDSSVRNGAQAVVHAEKACQLTSYKDPAYMDTLAAACAEAGDFTRAVRLQIVTVELAPEGWKNVAEQRLKFYEAGKPWREDPRRTQ